MPEKLKPCPVCGATGCNIEVTRGQVVCWKCLAQGSAHYRTADAVKQWNAMPRRLRWSKEPPTMPGWYWWKEGRNEESMIVHVFIVAHISGEKFLCAQFAGEGDIVHRIDKIDGEWAGPISEPEE